MHSRHDVGMLDGEILLLLGIGPEVEELPVLGLGLLAAVPNDLPVLVAQRPTIDL